MKNLKINAIKTIAVLSSAFILTTMSACQIIEKNANIDSPTSTADEINRKEEFKKEYAELIDFLDTNPTYFEENASFQYDDDGELIQFCIEIPITENETKVYSIGKWYFEFFNIPETVKTIKK